MKVTKSSGGVPRLSYTGRDDRHFLPTGLYIIKTVSGTYLSHLLLLLSALACQSLQVKTAFNYKMRVRSSEPWTMAYSKNSMKKFFFNKLTKESTYDMPPNAAAPFQYVSFSCSMWLVSAPMICAGVDLPLLYPQCLPCWALLLGLGGRGDRPWFTDQNGPRETIQGWRHVLRTPELPALTPPQNYWTSPAATPERFHYNIEDRGRARISPVVQLNISKHFFM